MNGSTTSEKRFTMPLFFTKESFQSKNPIASSQIQPSQLSQPPLTDELMTVTPPETYPVYTVVREPQPSLVDSESENSDFYIFHVLVWFVIFGLVVFWFWWLNMKHMK